MQKLKMKVLLLILTLLTSLMSMSQEPTKMLEIKFIGKYKTGRSPCEWLPDGSRRWALTTGFEINNWIKGNLKVNYIEISYDFDNIQSKQLISEQKYLVVLKLTEKRIMELELDKVNTIMTYHNPIKNEEIITIDRAK